MSNTAENPSPFDPLDRMEPDEPRFVIRGRDPIGPAVLSEYANLLRRRAIRELGENPHRIVDRKALKAAKLKAAEVDELAFAFQDYGSKAEQPAEQRLSHGTQQTVEQLAELHARKHRNALREHLQEARYHIEEARSGFVAGGFLAADSINNAELESMLCRLQQLYDEQNPVLPITEPKPDMEE